MHSQNDKKQKNQQRKIKFLIYCKRNPQALPKILSVVACCFFTFNLTPYSYAAVDISSPTPAISLFVVCLLSFMTVISFMPVQDDLFKKKPAVIITLAFIIIQIVLQISFISIMNNEINSVSAEELLLHSSWQKSINLSVVHLVWLALLLISIVGMPFYSKLLARINTSSPIEQDDDEDE